MTVQAAQLETINREVQKQVYSTIWMGRVFRGIGGIAQEKGKVPAVAMAVGSALGTFFWGASVYFSAEGAGRLFKEAADQIAHKEPLASEIGHGGEWSAQVLMYTVLFGWELDRIAAEGDYQKLLSVYEKMIAEHSEEDGQLPIKQLYRSLLMNLEQAAARSMFYKNRFKQREDALARFSEINLNAMDDESMELRLDRQVQDLFREIRKELESSLGLRNYPARLASGFKAVKAKRGWTGVAMSSLVGVVGPIFLGFQSVLSFVGAGLVFSEVYSEEASEADRAALGHGGEWPANGIAFALMAKLLHTWGLTSHGDFAIARQIIERRILELQNRENADQLLSRVSHMVNGELDQLNSYCMYKDPRSSYHIVEL